MILFPEPQTLVGPIQSGIKAISVLSSNRFFSFSPSSDAFFQIWSWPSSTQDASPHTHTQWRLFWRSEQQPLYLNFGCVAPEPKPTLDVSYVRLVLRAANLPFCIYVQRKDSMSRKCEFPCHKCKEFLNVDWCCWKKTERKKDKCPVTPKGKNFFLHQQVTNTS